MVVALKTDISAIVWSAQDTKTTFTWYFAKHASFQSRATHLEKTIKLYRGLSEEANNSFFLNDTKGCELIVPLDVIWNDAVMKNGFSKVEA